MTARLVPEFRARLMLRDGECILGGFDSLDAAKQAAGWMVKDIGRVAWVIEYQHRLVGGGRPVLVTPWLPVSRTKVKGR